MGSSTVHPQDTAIMVRAQVHAENSRVRHTPGFLLAFFDWSIYNTLYTSKKKTLPVEKNRFKHLFLAICQASFDMVFHISRGVIPPSGTSLRTRSPLSLVFRRHLLLSRYVFNLHLCSSIRQERSGTILGEIV